MKALDDYLAARTVLAKACGFEPECAPDIYDRRDQFWGRFRARVLSVVEIICFSSSADSVRAGIESYESDASDHGDHFASFWYSDEETGIETRDLGDGALALIGFHELREEWVIVRRENEVKA